jgi:aldehyde dehydrogenase (NAD+)
MRTVENVYIDGGFAVPTGTKEAPPFNPATEERIGTLRLGDAADIDRAVAAAKRAAPGLAAMPAEERIAMLERLSAAVAARGDALVETMREEYGAPPAFVELSSRRAGTVFLDMVQTLRDYDFRFTLHSAEIEMRPLGVAGAIVPWNSV